MSPRRRHVEVFAGPPAGTAAASSKLLLGIPTEAQDGDTLLAIAVGPPSHPDQPWQAANGAWSQLQQWVHMGQFQAPYAPGLPNPAEFDYNTECSTGVIVAIRGVSVVSYTGQACCEKPKDGLCNGVWHKNGPPASTCFDKGCSGLPTPQFDVDGVKLLVHAAACHSKGAPIDPPLGFTLLHRDTEGKIAFCVSYKEDASFHGVAMADPSRSGWVHGMSTIIALA
jgi:hypothetical protein